MVERQGVPGTDVTYSPSDRSLEVPSEVKRLTDRAKMVTVIWATEIRRQDATFAGMYCGPPANLAVIDVAQVPDQPALSDELGMATLVHETGHALYTPARQEEIQKRSASGLKGHDVFLFEAFLDVLEDERIERKLSSDSPEVVSHLERRWNWILETQAQSALATGAFAEYGPAQALAVARLDYLNRMLGFPNWYKKPEWLTMAPQLKAFLNSLRKLKKKELRMARWDTVPVLARQLVQAARDLA